MSEKVKAKVKALFPENVEGIYISKNDYDRLYGDLTLENIELKQEIERLNSDYLEMKDNFRNANDEIERLNNIINEIEKMFNHEILIKYYYGMSYEFEINDFKDDILKIIKGSDKK